MARHGVAGAPVWRAMRPGDHAAVVAIADAVHLAHPEDAAVPAERLALFPAGCLVATRAGAVVGYAVAHPWRAGAVPALDSLLGAIPPDADVLYLHDLALLPSARGLGAARAAVGLLRRTAGAHGFARIALTAVGGTAGVWGRLGFAVTDGGPDLAAKLSSYGPGAAYMVADA